MIRNTGQFDSVSAGAQLPLTKLTLIYAENGRGKTTLAAILRSLATGDGALIQERGRLGAASPPYFVIDAGAASPAVFQTGAWTATSPDLAVFDDHFATSNVCSGLAVESEHRQHLHELILGAQGVALNATLEGHFQQVEVHNKALREKERAIPAMARGNSKVDDFCALERVEDIDQQIEQAERALLLRGLLTPFAANRRSSLGARWLGGVQRGRRVRSRLTVLCGGRNQIGRTMAAAWID